MITNSTVLAYPGNFTDKLFKKLLNNTQFCLRKRPNSEKKAFVPSIEILRNNIFVN